jgi:uncharacterized protein YecE (DUF72 family)
VGTSGIVVPGRKEHFPTPFQSGSRLTYYASLFNTLEINSTFYKVPMATTFARWATEVPEDFRFTVKLWREITHARQLDFDPAHIGSFLEAAEQTGDKKGCLLVQFPGSITVKYRPQIEAVLRQLALFKSWRKAFEFRHPSWYHQSVYKLLDAYGASLVLHDKPAARNHTLNPEAEFVYLRFHGPGGDYKSSYDSAFLEEYAGLIQEWAGQGKDVYVYFNNTMGEAFSNAQYLIRCLKGQ